MVGDSLDYLEWKTGKRMEGVCFSWNSFVTKFNNAAGAILLSVGLVVFGFVQPVVPGEPLEQSETAVTGLYAMVTIIPAISFFISLVPAALNNYTGKRREFIKEELARKKSLAAMPAAAVSETRKETSPASIGNDARNAATTATYDR